MQGVLHIKYVIDCVFLVQIGEGGGGVCWQV